MFRNAIPSSVLTLFLLSLYAHAGQFPGMPLLQLLTATLALLLQLLNMIMVIEISNVFIVCSGFELVDVAFVVTFHPVIVPFFILLTVAAGEEIEIAPVHVAFGHAQVSPVICWDQRCWVCNVS